MSGNSGDNRDKRLDNLKPFKPGESGNPNGRPLGQKNYATLYREALVKIAKLNNKDPDELEMELISSGILNARKGDYRYYKDILDRLHGRPKETIDLNTKLEFVFDEARVGKMVGTVEQLPTEAEGSGGSDK